MPKVYFYKLTADSGGAPCVYRGLLSLAICKPMIRRTAQVGDLIFGFSANSLRRDNRLLYAARITETLRDGRYYRDPKYVRRDDCVYRFEKGRFVWRKGALHHGPKDLIHDLGMYPEYPRANVLLSDDFRYFGNSGTDKYKDRYPLVMEAVEALGRGARVWHDPSLHNELLMMAKWVWRSTRKKVAGRPTSAPSRRDCHRGRTCGVVSKSADF